MVRMAVEAQGVVVLETTPAGAFSGAFARTVQHRDGLALPLAGTEPGNDGVRKFLEVIYETEMTGSAQNYQVVFCGRRVVRVALGEAFLDIEAEDFRTQASLFIIGADYKAHALDKGSQSPGPGPQVELEAREHGQRCLQSLGRR